MLEVLMLISAHVEAWTVHALPLQSFDMQAQHEMAFRTLQSGLNTGKIVIRVATRSADQMAHAASHIVTGGTNGLGLLTGRWLTQCGGARCVILASRSGTLGRETVAERDALPVSSADVVCVPR